MAGIKSAKYKVCHTQSSERWEIERHLSSVEILARELSFHDGIRDESHMKMYFDLLDVTEEIRSILHKLDHKVDDLVSSGKPLPKGYYIVKP